jgi:hypothetical protein
MSCSKPLERCLEVSSHCLTHKEYGVIAPTSSIWLPMSFFSETLSPELISSSTNRETCRQSSSLVQNQTQNDAQSDHSLPKPAYCVSFSSSLLIFVPSLCNPMTNANAMDSSQCVTVSSFWPEINSFLTSHLSVWSTGVSAEPRLLGTPSVRFLA